jgi:transposase
MPKRVSRELRDRAVRMVREHREGYSSVTVASQAVAKQAGRTGDGAPVVVQAEVDAGGPAGV